MEHLLIGVALVHALWALVNSISIIESIFFSPIKKAMYLLLNWLVPIIGPLIISEKFSPSSIKPDSLTGNVDNPGTYYANSDSGSSDGGGGSGD